MIDYDGVNISLALCNSAKSMRSYHDPIAIITHLVSVADMSSLTEQERCFFQASNLRPKLPHSFI